jgi:AcrR family transcriptional regulator
MRNALVTSALRLLQRDGATALTVRNITAEAGCSTTGVYTYFGGKQGLIDQIFVAGFESFDEATGPALRSDDLFAAGWAYRQWALANPTQYMVMFGRAVPDYAPSEAARWRALQSFFDLAEAVGRVRPGPDHADRAFHLFATLHGYVMLELAGMASETIEQSDALFEGALRSLESGL